MPTLEQFNEVVEEMSVNLPYSSFTGIMPFVDPNFPHGKKLGTDCGNQSWEVRDRMREAGLKAHITKPEEIISADNRYQRIPTEHRATIVYKEGRKYLVDLTLACREMLDITDLQPGEIREFGAFPNLEGCTGTIKVFLDNKGYIRTQWCYPFKGDRRIPALTFIYNSNPPEINDSELTPEIYRESIRVNFGFYFSHFINIRGQFVRIFVHEPDSEDSKLGIKAPLKGVVLTPWDKPSQQVVDEISLISERIGVEVREIIEHHRNAHANMKTFLGIK